MTPFITLVGMLFLEVCGVGGGANVGTTWVFFRFPHLEFSYKSQLLCGLTKLDLEAK